MNDCDIIADLHAHPDWLARVLQALTRPARRVFPGGFIDAGHGRQGDDLAVLTRIRALIEDDGALAVMGNHELNAILFHRKGADDQSLRPYLDRNCRQHGSFIARFGIATPAAPDWTEWLLRALPLWRDLGGLRLVHTAGIPDRSPPSPPAARTAFCTWRTCPKPPILKRPLAGRSSC